MENPFIEKYIKQRMRELGYSESEYHYEPVRISLKDAVEPASKFFYNFTNPGFGFWPMPPQPQFTPNKFHIQAHNQFYFLIEKSVDPSLTIVSDSDCLTLKEAQNYTQYQFFNMKEFTGQIFLEKTSPGEIELEFIRCTPYKLK